MKQALAASTPATTLITLTGPNAEKHLSLRDFKSQMVPLVSLELLAYAMPFYPEGSEGEDGKVMHVDCGLTLQVPEGVMGLILPPEGAALRYPEATFHTQTLLPGPVIDVGIKFANKSWEAAKRTAEAIMKAKEFDEPVGRILFVPVLTPMFTLTKTPETPS